MTIQAGPAGLKQKEIQTDWPVEKGLEFGTQTQEGRTRNLVAKEGTVVNRVGKKGFQ